MDKTLSPLQIAFMIFIFITGSSLVYLPEMVAGQWAWIAVLLAAWAGFYILVLLPSIFSRFPGMSIMRISELLLGKALGTVLNILLFISLFFIAQGLIYNLSLLLRTAYPTIGGYILRSLLIFTAIFFLYRGPAMIGRLCETFLLLIILFFTLGIAASFPQMDINQLKPFGPEWKPLLSGFFFAVDSPFAQLVILASFLPLVQGLGKGQKAYWGFFLLAVLVLVIEDMHIFSILGRDLAEISRFPLLKVTRVIGFGEFRRLELFLFILWFITGFAALTIYYQGLILNLKGLLHLADYRPLIIPLGVFLLVSVTYMYPSDLDFITTRLRYVPFFTLPINLLYPTILFIATLLSPKHKHRAYNAERKI